MLTKGEACITLDRCNVSIGADFHALPGSAVEMLFAAARAFHYRKPKSANGSTARYFHAYLQRRAQSVGPLSGER